MDAYGNPAEGTVTVERGDNGNSRVEVKVEHLAMPSKVEGNASTYVVWVAPMAGATPQNVGVLAVDAEKLTGALTTVTPLSSFHLFVTAESEPRPAQPSKALVMSADASQ